MTLLATTPATVAQGTLEDITWGVDVGALLTGTQTATAPVARLTSPAGILTTLPDAVSVAGNVVRQRIRAGQLTVGAWKLAILITPSGTTNILESVLTISCPF